MAVVQRSFGVHSFAGLQIVSMQTQQMISVIEFQYAQVKKYTKSRKTEETTNKMKQGEHGVKPAK